MNICSERPVSRKLSRPAAGTLLAIVAIGLIGANGDAATVCVNPAGTNGCLSTIQAAVTAASPNDTVQVAKGTYKEIVVIDKSLSLVGAGSKNTIIEAAGLTVTVDGNNIGNGIFIDGIDNPGLSSVLVTGLAIRDASFEGILVANTSFVTIANNTLSGNNKSLSGETCPGAPVFETNEGFDCGEAIHLMGADHSTVSNNLITNNAGGILISDDTAVAHDNLVVGNTVKDNPFDCGITLASHAPAPPPFTSATAPLGVVHNTIAENLSTANGLNVSGAGAGVGIFDSVPGSINSGNVVINNTLTDNGLPGVALHSHTLGQFLNDNQIIDNVISGNGSDKAPTATTGTTGIHVFGVSAVTGTIIVGNTIKDESVDIVVNTPANVSGHLNDLKGSGGGVVNLSTGTTDATQNWWGCAKGPDTKGCSGTSGSVGAVLTTPFATKAF
jgi:parallel beta-helix repeat protein